MSYRHAYHTRMFDAALTAARPRTNDALYDIVASLLAALGGGSRGVIDESVAIDGGSDRQSART